MSFPDYYLLLGVASTASDNEIRQAYRRESLKTHPDRLPPDVDPAQKRRATEAFQALADAYYVLSNAQRRREYDAAYASRPDRTSDPSADPGLFSRFTSSFSTSGPTSRPDSDNVFADVFEEILRPEVDHYFPLWSYLGTVCGAGLGFIIANIPGLMVGGYAGNRLGAVRDAKGKSVAAVFSGLGYSKKAEILRVLAVKVLGSINA